MPLGLVMCGTRAALILVTAVLVGGCSAQLEPTRAPTRAAVAWADWRPQEPVRDLPRFTEAEKLAMRTEFLAGIAERYGIDDPPEVELERWIHPTEHGPTHEVCFAEAGFEVEGGPEGEGVQVVSRPAEAQRDLLNLAYYTCTARFFLDPDYTQLMTPDQLRVTYEYYREMLSPCLREQGYEPSEPPSLETFMATYGTADQWSPYDGLGITPEDRKTWERLYEGVCHGGPPAAARYGG